MNDFSENSYSPDYAEYISLPADGGKYQFRKFLIAAASIFCTIAFIIFILFKPQLAFFAFLVFFGIAFAVWYLWRFCSVEYEYVIAQGEMQFDIIYGAKQRKKYYECKIKKMIKIKKRDDALSDPDFSSIGRIINAASGRAFENEYHAIIEKEGGAKELLIFEANEKIIKIMKTFNMRAFL